MMLANTLTTKAAVAQVFATADHENELIAQILGGDERAYTLIMKRYDNLVRLTVARYIGQPEELREVVQDTFLRAYQALAGFRGESRLATWLVRIAVSVAINHTRKRTLAVTDLDGANANLPADHSLTEALRTQETREMVDELLARLPAEDADVLRLYYLGEHSVSEVCALTGLSVSNIKSRLMRARQRMRQAYERCYGTDVLN